jgi:uncharacterized protein YihD (DUF1040 family)
MKVRRYKPEDFEEIQRWAKLYDTTYSADNFPETGFIVDNLAAYFLYKTDSAVCFLENLISNKEADHYEKDKAINLIVEEILKEAKEQGFKVAYATTGIDAVVFRARIKGAKADANQTLLMKDLTQLK